MLSSTQRRRTSSPSIIRAPKLYGTFKPICTPATFESGFAASRRAPGTAASARMPKSRRLINMSVNRLVRDVEAAVDDRERFAQLCFGDAQRRIGEERVPAHERVEPFLPEESRERLHLVGGAVERRERCLFRLVAHQLDQAEQSNRSCRADRRVLARSE